MRTAVLLMIVVALVASTAACGPSTAVAAAGPAAVEQTADRCDDQPQMPAAPAASLDAVAAGGASVEPWLAPADAPAPLRDALAHRNSPGRATPLRL